MREAYPGCEQALQPTIVGMGPGHAEPIDQIDGGEGAAWGAGIGAATGTAAAAGSPGNQVAVGAGTTLEFRLAKPVSVDLLTQVAEAR